jgi:hypothetical protein
MKVRASLLFVLLFISVIFIFTPAQTVWGGYSMQTVPTIGPTVTPSATFTLTATSSATAIVPVVTTHIASPTNLRATIAITLITPAINETASPGSQETVIPSATSGQTEQVFTETEKYLPTDSSGSDMEIMPEKQTDLAVEPETDENPEIKNLPPQWLFPFIGITLFVIIILIIKRLFQNRKHKKVAK